MVGYLNASWICMIYLSKGGGGRCRFGPYVDPPLLHLSSEAERAAGNGRMKELYQITKTLCNEKSKTCNAVKDKDGNLLTNDSERRKSWQEHFEEILNRPIQTILYQTNQMNMMNRYLKTLIMTAFQKQKSEQQLERCEMKNLVEKMKLL